MQATRTFSFGDTRLPRRFWAKVEVGPDNCWTWTGSLSRGYGKFAVSASRPRSAYRVSFETLSGTIPAGLEIDHLCRNRACVNPAHLEPVTHLENMRRAFAATTHCPDGHEYTAENTRIDTRGCRACRACHAKWARERRARAKEDGSCKTH